MGRSGLKKARSGESKVLSMSPYASRSCFGLDDGPKGSTTKYSDKSEMLWRLLTFTGPTQLHEPFLTRV